MNGWYVCPSTLQLSPCHHVDNLSFAQSVCGTISALANRAVITGPIIEVTSINTMTLFNTPSLINRSPAGLTVL